MYKLIVLDCDGTLLNSKKEISERTSSTLKAVISKGVKVMIASARPFYRLKPILKQLGIDMCDQYTISFNGGLITNNTESETVFSSGFSIQQIKEVISTGAVLGTNMFLYARDAVFSNINDEKYKKNNPDVSFNVVDLYNFNLEQIYKIAYVNTPEETLKLRTKLPVEILDNYEITSSVPQFIEIVPKGITKSGALKIIGQRLGIESKDIIAFGDQENDIPMIAYAGCGVAMGNSPNIVKDKASFITTTNDEDGVAVAIEHFFDL